MKLSTIDHEIKQFTEETLNAFGWHKSLTAASLGISRPTLDSWIKKYQIKRPRNHRNGKRK